MPKAKRLPSGAYRCRVTWTETVGDQKVRKSKSFTAGDRRSAERAAAVFEFSHNELPVRNYTVGMAIDAFIEARTAALSPSTIRAYKSSRKNSYKRLEAVSVAAVDDRMVQAWVDDFKVGRSAKTVKNNYMLLQSALQMARPDLHLHVVLPQPKQAELVTPTDEDVKHLLKAAKGTDLEKCIYLAAFGTLRRSEICALTRADLTKTSVTVSKAMVTDGKEWVVKSPKTSSSYRTVELPPTVIRRILKGTKEPTDRIVSINPNQLSIQFYDLVRAEKLPQFRFHDLRAYAASMRHALGIPDQFIQADGGWKSDVILKRCYRRALEDKRKEFSKISNQHFASLIK